MSGVGKCIETESWSVVAEVWEAVTVVGDRLVMGAGFVSGLMSQHEREAVRRSFQFFPHNLAEGDS